jgi:hypothetical protein
MPEEVIPFELLFLLLLEVPLLVEGATDGPTLIPASGGVGKTSKPTEALELFKSPVAAVYEI